MKSDGSTAKYYELPEGCTQLQDLISHRNMNAQIGEVFRACYRYGMVEHSEMLRDAKKIKFYAEAEIARLEKLADPNIGEAKGADGSVISWKIASDCDEMTAGEKMKRDMSSADLGAYCSRNADEVFGKKLSVYSDPAPSLLTRYPMPDGGYIEIYKDDIQKIWTALPQCLYKHVPTGLVAEGKVALIDVLYKLDHPSIIKYTPT